MAIPVALKLPRSYDVGLLLEDVKAVERVRRVHEPYTSYHNGRWMGIPLVSAGGRADRAHGPFPGAGAGRDTKLLQHTPYFRKVLDELHCPKQVVRLLELYPGGEIREHRDPLHFSSGIIRLHLPIVSHPQLIFVVGGEECHFQPGELWWADFSLPHRVSNPTLVTKVALVIDVMVNEFVLGLFPPEIVAQIRRDGVLLYQPPIELDESRLQRLVCRFQFPSGLIPQVKQGGAATIEVRDGRPVLLLGEAAPFALEAISERSLAFSGWGAGVALEYELDGNRIASLTLALRGMNGFEPPGAVQGEDATSRIALQLL